MSGHSKWHNIQMRKGAQDRKRANVFTKLAHVITVAAREGGGDPATNASLRIAIEKARASSMPKDNIQRAIDRGTGAGGGAALSSVVYEGKGPGNIDILVGVLTDNKNRSASDIRTIFMKNGGSMGGAGSVSWNFEQQGYIQLSSNVKNQMSNQAQSSNDQIILSIMDVEGVQDVEESNDDGFDIYTAPKDLSRVHKQLEEKGFIVEKAELFMDPKNTVKIDEEKSEQAVKLLELLDDYEDTENVWTNME